MGTFLVLTGILIATQNNAEIGREEYRDDGVRLESKVRLAGRMANVAFDRKTRVYTIDHRPGETIDDGVYPIENGAWQSYALLLDGKIPFGQPTPIKLRVPSLAKTLDATALISPTKLGHKIKVTIGGIEVVSDVTPDGRVVHCAVAAQHIEVTLGSEAPVPDVLPSGVRSELFTVERPDATLVGELFIPKQPTQRLILIIAGSGPTDRDGNSSLGLHSNVYRDLAKILAHDGNAVARFDKRGVGGSTVRTASPPVIEDFIGDAEAIAQHFAQRYPVLIVAGHSEGGLIALEMGVRKHVKPARLLLLATAGRPLRDVIREQLARQYDVAVLGAYDRIVGEIVAGNTPAPASIPTAIAPLFGANVLPFMRSILAIDPVALIKQLDPKIVIKVLQGSTDIQVTEADARRLAGARDGIWLHLVPEANHLFRREKTASLKQTSYGDPLVPFAADLVPALDAALR